MIRGLLWLIIAFVCLAWALELAHCGTVGGVGVQDAGLSRCVSVIGGVCYVDNQYTGESPWYCPDDVVAPDICWPVGKNEWCCP